MVSVTGTSRTAKFWDRKDILPLALFLILFLLMFREFFFADRTIFDRDVTLWEIPARKLCAQLLKEGNFALWTDAYGGGQPFLANLKAAALYPAMVLYLVLPFFTAFKLYFLVHVALTWTGTYFLGKSYALSRRASFLGASLFVFGGMYLSSFEFYNHLAALAWLPWILILLIRPLPRWAPRLAALAVLWTLSILAGAPEITLITLALATLQILFLASDRGRGLFFAAGSFVLALLISAAQLLPSFDLLKQSERSSSRFVEWSLEAVQLLNLPFANILGSDRAPGHHLYWAGHFFDRGYPLYYSLYLGLGALVLAAWALARLRERKVLFLGVSTIFFLILASGKYSPFGEALGSIPLISSIRYPVKFLVGSIFSVCLLAGAGFDGLFNDQHKKRSAPFALAAALAAAALLFALFSHPLSEVLRRAFDISQASDTAEVRASFFSAALLAALIASAIFLSQLSAGWRRVAPLLLIAVVILDLAYHNRHINPLVSASFFNQPVSASDKAPPVRLFRENDVLQTFQRGKTDILRLARYARQTAYPLTGIGDGVFYLFDEDTLDIYPREYRRLCEGIEKCPLEDRLKILRTEGCQYYVSRTRIPGLRVRELDTGEGGVFVHELAGPAPRVRLVHERIVASSRDAKLGACLRPDFDPERTAIIDTPLPLEDAGPGAEKESAEIAEIRQGVLRGRVSLSRAGIMVVPGNFAGGWRARIDGRPAEVFRANLSSKGVLVPAGIHRVELRYAPASFRVGMVISALGLLGLAALSLISAVRGDLAAGRGCLTANVLL
jgi:hypothetical protein